MRVVLACIVLAMATLAIGQWCDGCREELRKLQLWAKDFYFPLYMDSPISMNDWFGNGDPNFKPTQQNNAERAELIDKMLNAKWPVEYTCMPTSAMNPKLGWYPNLALCAMLDRILPSMFTDLAMIQEIKDLLQFAIDHRDPTSSFDNSNSQYLAHFCLAAYQTKEVWPFAIVADTDTLLAGFVKTATPIEAQRARDLVDKMKKRLFAWKPSAFYNATRSCTYAYSQSPVITPLTLARREYMHRVGMFRRDPINRDNLVPLERGVITGGDFASFRLNAVLQNESLYNIVHGDASLDGLILTSALADLTKFEYNDILVHTIICGDFALTAEEKIQMDWIERLYPCNQDIYRRYYRETLVVAAAETLSHESFNTNPDVAEYAKDPAGFLKLLVSTTTTKLEVAQDVGTGVDNTKDVVRIVTAGFNTAVVGVPLVSLGKLVMVEQNQKIISAAASKPAGSPASPPEDVLLLKFGALVVNGVVSVGGALLMDDPNWRQAVASAKLGLGKKDCMMAENSEEGQECMKNKGEAIFKTNSKSMEGTFNSSELGHCSAEYPEYLTQGVSSKNIKYLPFNWALAMWELAETNMYNPGTRPRDLEAEARRHIEEVAKLAVAKLVEGVTTIKEPSGGFWSGVGEFFKNTIGTGDVSNHHGK